jgi:hypothetical protein
MSSAKPAIRIDSAIKECEQELAFLQSKEIKMSDTYDPREENKIIPHWNISVLNNASELAANGLNNYTNHEGKAIDETKLNWELATVRNLSSEPYLSLFLEVVYFEANGVQWLKTSTGETITVRSLMRSKLSYRNSTFEDCWGIKVGGSNFNPSSILLLKDGNPHTDTKYEWNKKRTKYNTFLPWAVYNSEEVAYLKKWAAYPI